MTRDLTPGAALRALLDELESELKRIAKINTEEDRQRVVPELTVWMWLQKARAALPPEGRHPTIGGDGPPEASCLLCGISGLLTVWYAGTRAGVCERCRKAARSYSNEAEGRQEPEEPEGCRCPARGSEDCPLTADECIARAEGRAPTETCICTEAEIALLGTPDPLCPALVHSSGREKG